MGRDFQAWLRAAGSLNLIVYPYPRLQILFPAEFAGISSCTPPIPRQGREDPSWDKIHVNSCILQNETKTLIGAVMFFILSARNGKNMCLPVSSEGCSCEELLAGSAWGPPRRPRRHTQTMLALAYGSSSTAPFLAL